VRLLSRFVLRWHVHDDEGAMVYAADDLFDVYAWWRVNGRQGDYLAETGERLDDLVGS
jgi:hypothetical protein